MHAALPKKFSIAMWKAYLQSLSADDRIRHIGIPMVSQCECCEDGTLEELNHVLYGGRMASMLWKTCSLFLGIPYVEKRFPSRELEWAACPGNFDLESVVSVLTCVYGRSKGSI